MSRYSCSDPHSHFGIRRSSAPPLAMLVALTWSERSMAGTVADGWKSVARRTHCE